MSDINKVIIGGRLTKDVELRYTNGGTAVADCSIANNRTYKDQEEVSFVDVTIWGKSAENAAKHLSKGRYVFIEGRLKQERWETEGNKRSKVSVTADRWYFAPSDGKRDSVPSDDSDDGQEDTNKDSDDGNIPF